MPAIQVAKTDTFESQRQKINQIGSQVFSITQGGSDLATGNLKIGDGTRTAPSMAFASDNTLGIYKSTDKTIGFVVDGRKNLDVFSDSVTLYRDLFLQKRSVQSSGVIIQNPGQRYDSGEYTNIPLVGGSGSGILASITVVGFLGSITNSGSNYLPGNYSDVVLSGGSGSGAVCTFNVQSIDGDIDNNGSGYFPGQYANVPLSGGSGSGAKATVTIADDLLQQSTVSGSITNPGSSYVDSTYSQVVLYNTPTTVYTVTVVSNPGSPPPSNVYQIDGNTQQSLSLAKGNTYRFDISDSSLSGHPFIFETAESDSLDGLYYVVVKNGTEGQPNSFVDIIIKPSAPTETIYYDCSSHDGMGASIGIISGSLGQYGSGATASLEVSGNIVTSCILSSIGTGYQSGDVLQISNINIGGSGSGFEYTISSVNPQGEVANFFITDSGQDYVIGDILTLDNLYFGGEGSGFQFTVSTNPGKVNSIDFTSYGSGYAINDLLSFPQSVNGLSTSLVSTSNIITVSSVSGIYAGYKITQTSGTGQIADDTTVLLVNNALNQITLSQTPSQDGTAVLNFVPPYGDGSDQFQYTISDLGIVSDVLISDGGNGYFEGDILSVSPFDLTTPITYSVANREVQKITFVQTIPDSVFSTSDTISVDDAGNITQLEIYEAVSSGGNLLYLVVSNNASISSGFEITKTGDPTLYEVDVQTSINKFFIDTGSGYNYAPSLTLFAGNTYSFDTTDPSNSSHNFSLSQNPDGTKYTVSGFSATLAVDSKTVSLLDTTGLYPGMSVIVFSGDGQLPTEAAISSVDSLTQITLNSFPDQNGNVVLNFLGSEYLDGVVKSANSLVVKILETTNTLYYYCNESGVEHENEGSKESNQSVFTIDTNNPRVFGSGLELKVTDVLSSDTITFDLLTGEINSQVIRSSGSFFDQLTVTSSISCNSISSDQVNTENLASSQNLQITSPTIRLDGVVNFGSSCVLDTSTGNLSSSGVIKTTNLLNVNDVLKIQNNNIFTTAGYDVVITPNSGRVAKVSASSAFIIPVGTDAERPGAAIRENGSIRFNTTSNQYEGYSASTQSWSSLGGVRDIDGNTYILAELSAGANDNTLWFFNDSINTLKLTKDFLDFRSVKKISSGRLGLPTFSVWTANTPVSVGQYIKYKNNLYEVTASGTTASSGNEPTHTSGVANNGTAQFTWYSPSVSPITFEEVQELRVGPSKDCPLIVSSETKVFNNVISTLVEDLVLAPNSGKKVSIDAPTSLVIPVGNTNQRGSASQGSIRFNTTISQFEGYSGTNWSSLGGVRDVDGNTYIIPETAPAANENILYFYNDGTNTLQLSSTGLDFTNIDTITTSGGNTLAINTDILTLDNSATTIDNTDSTSSFISTTKQYLDLGLSSGLNVDPVLRLDDQGDVYLNTGFGTGTFSGVKIFDGDLKDFELADYLVKTSVLSLIKGTSNSGAVVLYDTATAKGCRVTVVSKSSTGKKSMVEYNVIDNGTDIFHNEFGSLNTSVDGFEAVFDITPGNETRITLTLSDDHATNDTVEITVLTQVVK